MVANEANSNQPPITKDCFCVQMIFLLKKNVFIKKIEGISPVRSQLITEFIPVTIQNKMVAYFVKGERIEKHFQEDSLKLRWIGSGLRRF